MMKRMIAIALAGLLAGLATARADDYPNRSITLIVPFAAGGPTDALARLFADRLRVALGQTVLVENITGAAGSIAVGRAVRSAPDGYTLSIGHWSTHVLNGAIYNLPYDLRTDLAPIALLASNPQLIAGKTSWPAKDLKSLIAWLNDNPGKATVGTAGPGSASHIGGVYFAEASKTQVQFVPYRGTGPAMQDLIAGQIDLVFDQSASSLPQVRAGAVKAFAVTAKTRLASAPDIPTVDEAGLPGFYIAVWHGLWAPKDTPKPIIAKLAAAVRETLADETVRKRLVDLGQDLPSAEQQTPEGLAAFQKAEIEKWWPIIKASGLKVE